MLRHAGRLVVMMSWQDGEVATLIEKLSGLAEYLA